MGGGNGWEPRSRWPARGRLVRRWRAPQLLLKEKSYPPGVRIPRHDHSYTKVCLTLSGGCTEERDGRRHHYAPGTLQLNPVGSSHAYRCGERGMRVFSATLGPAWWPLLDTLRPAPVAAGRDAYGVALAQRLYGEFLRPCDASPMVIEELLLALMAPEARGSEARGTRREPVPDWLATLLTVVQDTFRGPVGLAGLAAEVGIDRSHLARAFRRRFGCTIGEYVRGLRVAHARLLLVETERPLAEVALAAGFADQSHMGRTFRALLGRTPGDVRAGATPRTLPQ